MPPVIDGERDERYDNHLDDESPSDLFRMALDMIEHDEIRDADDERRDDHELPE